ncbi:MAG TPA: hypothetical protein VF933_21440, partial [Streptosporangiaceae bacterium]
MAGAFPQDLGFVLDDGDLIGGVAVATLPAARGLALFGGLAGGAALPLPLVLRLMPRGRPKRAGHQPAGRRCQ